MKYNPRIVIAFMTSHGLPAPIPEFTFHETRKWRFDFAWPLQRIALEVDGGIFVYGGHNRGAQIKKTWEKENTAQSMGWNIFKCEPKTLMKLETIMFLAGCMNFRERYYQRL